MDIAEIFVTSGGLVLIAATLWFFFGQRDEPQVLAAKESLYACPMHPWITSSDAAATCSICGMKLTRSEASST